MHLEWRNLYLYFDPKIFGAHFARITYVMLNYWILIQIIMKNYRMCAIIIILIFPMSREIFLTFMEMKLTAEWSISQAKNST